jgi:hypothetical protein
MLELNTFTKNNGFSDMLDPIASVFGVVYDKLVGAIITLLGISHLISFTIIVSTVSIPIFILSKI